MAKVIRVDDDVYEGLKKIADPFEDTPNTVIRKLLHKANLIAHVSKPLKPHLSTSKKKLTPQPIYEKFLLYTLHHDFNGTALKAEVTQKTISHLKDRNILGDDDFEIVSTGETKAANTIAWSRNRLKDSGYIKSDSIRGVWELTPEGHSKAGLINIDDITN